LLKPRSQRCAHEAHIPWDHSIVAARHLREFRSRSHPPPLTCSLLHEQWADQRGGAIGIREQSLKIRFEHAHPLRGAVALRQAVLA
jgi:hypothetical protein